jgi:hypothetical protein
VRLQAPVPIPTSPLGPFENGLGAVVLVLSSAVLVGIGAGLEPKLGVAALLAVAAGLTILVRPATAVLTVVALAPVICGLKRGLIVPGLRPSEVLVAGVAGPVLLFAGFKVSTRWRLLDSMALAYVVGTLVLGAGDMLVRDARFTADLNGQLIGPLQYFLLYRSVAVALDTSELRRRAMRLLLLGSIPVCISGLLQLFNLGPTRAFIDTVVNNSGVSEADAPGGLARASGIMDHWHSLGAYMLVIVLLAVALLLDGRQRVMSRPWLIAVLAFATVGLASTLTFAPIIGAIAGSIVLGAMIGQSRKVVAWMGIGALAVGIILGPFFANRLSEQFGDQVAQASGIEGPSFLPQTLRYRIEVWRDQYLPVVGSHLLTGYGPGLPPYVNWEFTETLYITLLLRGGIPLLAIYAALMFAAWSLARWLLPRAGPDDRCTARVVLTLILLLVPMHFIVPYFVNTGLTHPLWILLGMVSAAAGQLEQLGPPLTGEEGNLDSPTLPRW